MEKETEFKALITQEQYLRIAEEFPFGEAQKQENFYYIDREEKMRSGKSTVRIREKGGKRVLQIKIHRSTEGAVVSSDEHHRPMESIPERLTADMLPIIPCDGITELRLMGSLVTYRRLCKGDNYEICLDKNEYWGITDYEIEVEFQGDIPADVIEKLTSAGVNTEGGGKGKYFRFLSAYEESKK